MAAQKGTEDAPKRKRGRGADPEETRQALLRAAIDSLVEDGYRGTTARSIGTRATCNQAAIYYHFGGIENLLIEALRVSSAARLERYEDALPQGVGLQELISAIEELYVEDRSSGHLGLLTELVGGITASPELRVGIEEATQPWLDFVEGRIVEASKDLPFGAAMPARDVADVVFSLVIGVELRNKIDGKLDRSDRLFRLARLAAGIAEASASKG